MNNTRVSLMSFVLCCLATLCIFGCGGNGAGSATTGNETGTFPILAGILPLNEVTPSTPLITRRAKGFTAADHRGEGKVETVFSNADGTYILISALNGTMFNHGWSGTPIHDGNRLIGAVSAGMNNSSGVSDTSHAFVIPAQTMLDEYMGVPMSAVTRSLAAKQPKTREIWTSAPTERITTWGGKDVQKERDFRFVKVPAESNLAANQTRGGNPYVLSQGTGVVVMYSPLAYAAGHVTMNVDEGKGSPLLIFGHGMTGTPKSISHLPAQVGFTFTMNDGTRACLPYRGDGFAGTVTGWDTFYTVVDPGMDPEVVYSVLSIEDGSGANIGGGSYFLGRDGGSFEQYLFNFVNLDTLFQKNVSKLTPGVMYDAVLVAETANGQSKYTFSGTVAELPNAISEWTYRLMLENENVEMTGNVTLTISPTPMGG